MHAILVSDVHLVHGEDAAAAEFLGFLLAETRPQGHLYLLGDIFDVWPGTRAYFRERYGKVLETFAELARRGVKVHYVEGNHDFRLGESFQRLGVETHSDRLAVDFDGLRTLLVHGDLGDADDVWYPRLRTFLRSTLLQTSLRILPGRLVHWMGETWSRLSREKHMGPNGRSPHIVESIRDRWREAARRIAAEGHDVVIMGHTHIADDTTGTTPAGKYRYFNLGDWVGGRTYLEFQDGEFYTRRYR